MLQFSYLVKANKFQSSRVFLDLRNVDLHTQAGLVYSRNSNITFLVYLTFLGNRNCPFFSTYIHLDFRALKTVLRCILWIQHFDLWRDGEACARQWMKRDVLKKIAFNWLNCLLTISIQSCMHGITRLNIKFRQVPFGRLCAASQQCYVIWTKDVIFSVRLHEHRNIPIILLIASCENEFAEKSTSIIVFIFLIFCFYTSIK